MTLTEFDLERLRLSKLIDAGIATSLDYIHKAAEAERVYRKARREAWLHCPVDPSGVKAGDREWTAARREDWVDAETADLRFARDVALSMRFTAKDAIDARLGQLQSLQSSLSFVKAEMEFARSAA